MNEPYIQLSGNLGGDPELRYTANGTPVLDFRVATTQRKRVGDNEWADGETLWFDVTCWKQLAENVAESLHKGDRVNVSGLLAQSSYTREDGTVSTKLVINGSKVGVDLSRSTAKISRTVRQMRGRLSSATCTRRPARCRPSPSPGRSPSATRWTTPWRKPRPDRPAHVRSGPAPRPRPRGTGARPRPAWRN